MKSKESPSTVTKDDGAYEHIPYFTARHILLSRTHEMAKLSYSSQSTVDVLIQWSQNMKTLRYPLESARVKPTSPLPQACYLWGIMAVSGIAVAYEPSQEVF